MDFAAMAQQCAPNVHADTLHRVASVESNFNPFAIGVVGGRLQRQPHNLAEAVATAQMLETSGYNYSLGMVQVNKKNLAKYGLTPETAFDPCANLRAGGQILEDCYHRAGNSSSALGDAFSCYYSGNFKTGYRTGYVAKVQNAAGLVDADALNAAPIPVVPQMTGRAWSTRRRVVTIASGSPAALTPSSSDSLFVSVPSAPVEAVADASGNPPSQPKKGPTTALLF